MAFVKRLSEVWHSTDSVLYLERLVDEKDSQIEFLKGLLAQKEFYQPEVTSTDERPIPQPIKRESWSTLQQRIKREMRKQNADTASEGTN